MPRGDRSWASTASTFGSSTSSTSSTACRMIAALRGTAPSSWPPPARPETAAYMARRDRRWTGLGEGLLVAAADVGIPDALHPNKGKDIAGHVFYWIGIGQLGFDIVSLIADQNGWPAPTWTRVSKDARAWGTLALKSVLLASACSTPASTPAIPCSAGGRRRQTAASSLDDDEHGGVARPLRRAFDDDEPGTHTAALICGARIRGHSLDVAATARPDVLSVGTCDPRREPAIFSGSDDLEGAERCLKPDVLAPGGDRAQSRHPRPITPPSLPPRHRQPRRGAQLFQSGGGRRRPHDHRYAGPRKHAAIHSFAAGSNFASPESAPDDRLAACAQPRRSCAPAPSPPTRGPAVDALTSACSQGRLRARGRASPGVTTAAPGRQDRLPALERSRHPPPVHRVRIIRGHSALTQTTQYSLSTPSERHRADPHWGSVIAWRRRAALDGGKTHEVVDLSNHGSHPSPGPYRL